MDYILAPSVLSADFSKLGQEIRECADCGVKYVHLDVMDGMFVPNITFGPPIIRKIRKCSEIVFDVHLMIEEPYRYIDDFADAGADIITVHYEACTHLDSTIEAIKKRGLRSGVALNPSTPVEVLDCILERLDMVLIMSVNPGFGNQSFIPYTLEKIKKLRAMITSRGLAADIEVDGGINLTTAASVIEAGANVLVAGAAVFDTGKEANIRKFLDMLDES